MSRFPLKIGRAACMVAAGLASIVICATDSLASASNLGAPIGRAVNVVGKWHYVRPNVRSYRGDVTFVVPGRVFSGTIRHLYVDDHGRLTLDASNAPRHGLTMRPGSGVSHVYVSDDRS